MSIKLTDAREEQDSCSADEGQVVSSPRGDVADQWVGHQLHEGLGGKEGSDPPVLLDDVLSGRVGWRGLGSIRGWLQSFFV